MYEQVIEPDLSIQAENGWCLWFQQEVFSVPHLYRSATIAYEATQFRHFEREMPNVAVPVWFEHWGTYGTPPTYANWGHVVTWVPSRGKFLSVIGIGYGQQWFNTLKEVESYFKAKYICWTEDISGVRVVQPKEEDMKFTKEQYMVAAESVGTQLGKDFNFDADRNMDQFVQLFESQAPTISKDMEHELADKLTGIKSVIGPDYNSPFVGQKVVTHYPQMVDFWMGQADAVKDHDSNVKPTATELKPGTYIVK